MISRYYYKESNLVNTYLGNKVQHYLVKERSIAVTSYPYVVQPGDTMYTLAKFVFGEDQEFQWTIISDINYLRQPDELQPGEIINLPKVILSELKQQITEYAATPASTTKI